MSNELHHEKTGFLPLRKQRRGSADQLCSNCTADQRLCFSYTDSTISLLLKFKLLAIFYTCTARFLSDHVGNPEDRFSCVTAHIWMVFLNHDFLGRPRPSEWFLTVLR